MPTNVAVTWAEHHPAAPEPPGREHPSTGGRLTVLPRLELDGIAARLVRDERPRYQVVERLGEGGLGTVVAARDLDIGRKVAIKTIRPERQSNAAFLRFVQEVRIVGQLDHPNIVPVHDVGRDEAGAYYLVMKCVEGETLEAVIDRLRTGDRATHAHWTFERRVEAFREVLKAVHFAHRRGVVHRDIKPANIMIGPFGEVQVLDWGVARPLDAPELPAGEDEVGSGPARARESLSVTTTRAGALIGTPKYMSPEQARGERVDERTDVWALALLLYELLTLRHFLDGVTDLDAVIEAVQSRPIPHPREQPSPHQPPVPVDLSWFLLDGLRRDPAERIPTVAAMIERLDRRLEGEVDVRCPVTLQLSLLARAQRWVDRNPGLAMAGLGGALLSAVVGAVAAAGAAILGLGAFAAALVT